MKKAPKIRFHLLADGTWKSTQGRSLLTIGDDTFLDARAALKVNYVIGRDGYARPRHETRQQAALAVHNAIVGNHKPVVSRI